VSPASAIRLGGATVVPVAGAGSRKVRPEQWDRTRRGGRGKGSLCDCLKGAMRRKDVVGEKRMSASWTWCTCVCGTGVRAREALPW